MSDLGLDFAPSPFAAGEDHLGSCLMASDVPFKGMGLDIFNRRVQGVSWKDIADEFNLGTPSKARTAFTKLTGITDYKIKGPQLVKLAQGGLDESLTVSLKVKKAMKATKKNLTPDSVLPDMSPEILKDIGLDVKKKLFDVYEPADFHLSINKTFFTEKKGLTSKQMDFLKGFTDATEMTPSDLKSIYDKFHLQKNQILEDYLKGAKASAKKFTKAPDIKQAFDKEWTDTELSEHVFKLHKEGKGYLKISHETGMPMADVDKTVWNSLLKESDGDVWKAYKKKPGSQEGFDSVKQVIFDQRKAGKTLKEVADVTDIDPDVVKAVVEGKWKLPNPGVNNYYKPPSYAPAPSFTSTPSAPMPKWGNEEFPGLTRQQMIDAGLSPQVSPAVKNELRRYTGGWYRDVNSVLREGSTYNREAVMRSVDKMDEGMLPSPISFTVSRGMDRNGFGMGYLSDDQLRELPGVMMKDRGFMSTSVREVFRNDIRLVIECPPGTRGYFVQPFSNYPMEDEYVLARSTNIMITKAEKINGKWVVHGRVVP